MDSTVNSQSNTVAPTGHKTRRKNTLYPIQMNKYPILPLAYMALKHK